MKKRLFSILLTLALLLSLVPGLGVFAGATGATPDTSWYNTTDTTFILYDTADLEGLASLVNGGNTFAGKTIQLADTFNDTTALTTPIGKNYTNCFKGTFDGNGRNVVLGISITSTDSNVYAGLFGDVEHGTVKNVSTSGTVKASGNSDYSYAGGVVGYSSKNATVSNCHATGTVTVTGGSTYNCSGGVVGANVGTVINCYATGAVTATGNSKNYSGGVIGLNDTSGTVINCYATGEVSGSHAGGVVGLNNGTVSNCYATGKVTTSGGTNNYAGGVVGFNSGTVSNCYATGEVSGYYAGGVVGANVSYGNVSSGTVSNCYATGEVSGSYAGGVVGRNIGTVSNCYYKSVADRWGVGTTNGTDPASSEASGCTALPEAQMKAKAGETNAAWTALEGKSMVDALNAYVSNDPDKGYSPWVRGNDGYPTLLNFDGSGGENDPYLLHSTADLVTLAEFVNWGNPFENTHFKLADDFNDTTALTTPIGDYSTETSVFSGTFDGNGKNLVLNISAEVDYAGLFGYIGENGTVKNVSTTGGVTAAKNNGSYNYAGGVVGYNKGTVINCYATGNVTAKYGTSRNYAGGVVGFNDEGAVENCYAEGVVSASDSCYAAVGGVIGTNWGTVMNCYATGGVTGTGTGTADEDICAGGVIGVNYSHITNCYATGNVTSTGTGTAGGLIYAGGVVGYNEADITNCYATGNVTSTGTADEDICAGGVVGYIDGSASNCYYRSVADLWGVGKTYGSAAATSEAPGCTALPADQMKAGAGETNAEWTALDKKSMVDALNSYSPNTDFQPMSVQETPSLRNWGVMDNLNGGYPVFALDTPIYLSAGSAYSAYTDKTLSGSIPLPAGINYDNGTYTFTNVNLPSLGENCLTILDETATVNLAGQNQLGAKADYTADTGFRAVFGLSSTGSVTFTGSGSLTIYDMNNGITAKNITFDPNFRGTLTVNDYGQPQVECCLKAVEIVTINSGTFVLNNATSYGISANTVTINGGKLSVKGGTAAISAETSLTIADTLEATGQDTTSTDTILYNQTGNNAAEYVTIQAKQAAPSGNSGSSSKSTVTVPVEGDKDAVKVQATVSGTNATIKNVTATGIEKVGTDSTVEVNLTSLKPTVTGLTIPTTTVENIAASEVQELAVKYPSGAAVGFDKAAVTAIAEQAEGKSVQITVNTGKKAENSMNTAQKETSKSDANPQPNVDAAYSMLIDEYDPQYRGDPATEMDRSSAAAMVVVAVTGKVYSNVVEVKVTSGGKEIHDFQGGTATVSVPVTAAPGSTAIVNWLKEDGTFERVNTAKLHFEAVENTEKAFCSFETNHLSHYVILILEDGTQICPKDSTCVYAKFTDADPTAWYHDGVHFCVEKAYMNGVSDTKFAPNGTLSRAMLVTMLWRMEGSPVVNYAMSFTDVAADEWYTEAVRWAADAKIVDGYSDTAFGPNDNVTREQLAAILMRYADFKGIDVSARNDLAAFTDAGEISGWALENLQWANAVEMIKGRTETTIAPTGSATRAEAATMLYRFCMTVLK